MLTDDEIKCIAIAVRTNVTNRWHHPDWNYMYYDQFEKAVADGIRLALKKAADKATPPWSEIDARLAEKAAQCGPVADH